MAQTCWDALDSCVDEEGKNTTYLVWSTWPAERLGNSWWCQGRWFRTCTRPHPTWRRRSPEAWRSCDCRRWAADSWNNTTIVVSVIRCIDYFFNIWPFKSIKFRPIAYKFAKSGWTFCQIFCKPSKTSILGQNCGEISPNLVTLIVVNDVQFVFILIVGTMFT